MWLYKNSRSQPQRSHFFSWTVKNSPDKIWVQKDSVPRIPLVYETNAMKEQFLLLGFLSVGTLSLGMGTAEAAVLSGGFASSYTLNNLGSVTGVPTNYGGITFKDANTLLLGGSANNSGGAIYSIPLTRGGTNNSITSFGAPTLFATAPNIDGGLTFGPGGVLFYTGYPNNVIGQIKPGSTAPDKVTNLSTLLPNSIASSAGSLAFVPSGFSGAGNFKIASFNAGTFYSASLVADGSGTYNIQNVSSPLTISATRQPEGIAYIAAGNPLFTSNSLLLSEYDAGRVSAFTVDSNGDPIISSRQDFITGLSGAEGATIDPVSGDFLFSTFGSGNEIFQVQGFQAPSTPTTAVPEPFTVIGSLIGGTAAVRMRKKLLKSPTK
jgi:hypothetical protein